MLGHFSFRSNPFHRSDGGIVNSAEVVRASAEVPRFLAKIASFCKGGFCPRGPTKLKFFPRVLGLFGLGFQVVHTLEVAGSNSAAATWRIDQRISLYEGSRTRRFLISSRPAGCSSAIRLSGISDTAADLLSVEAPILPIAALSVIAVTTIRLKVLADILLVMQFMTLAMSPLNKPH